MNVLQRCLMLWQLLGPLASEVALTVLVIAAASRVVKAAAWRRALWQVCFVALLALFLVETTGVLRPLTQKLRANAQSVLRSFEGSRPHHETVSALGMAREIPRLESRFKTTTPEADRDEPASGFGRPFSGASADLTPPTRTAASAAALSSDPEPVSASVAESIGLVWLMGSAVYFAWLAIGLGMVALFHRRATRVADPALARVVSVLGRQLGFRRRVRLLHCERLKSPVAFGIIRPTISLPQDFMEKFDFHQQKAVLAHELAHLALRDPIWQTVVNIMTGLLWWHPLVWWAGRQWRLAGECAADERSVEVAGTPEALAECLLNLGQRLTENRSWRLLAIDGDGFQSSLGHRVARLLAMRNLPERGVHRTPGVFFLVIGPALLVGVTACLSAWSSTTVFGKDEFTTTQPVMKTIHQSWSRSLFAITLAAALGNIAANPADEAQNATSAPPTSPGQTIQNETAPEQTSSSPKPFAIDPALAARYGLRSEAIPTADEGASGTPTPVMDEALMRRYGLHRYGLRRPVVVTNLTGKSSAVTKAAQGRQAVRVKLEEIVLDQVLYNGIPLSEVVKDLKAEAAKRDPAGRGINFLINSSPREAAFPGIDPITGQPLPPQSTDIGSSLVRIDLPLKDVRLIDVLDVIRKVSAVPLRYSIEDYGVVFSPANQPSGQMVSRTFKIDPATLTQGLENAAGLSINRSVSRGKTPSQQVTDLLREFLVSAGVTIDSPNQLFYNDRTGILMIRVNDLEQDIVQAAVEMLSGESAPGDKVLGQAPKGPELPPELRRRYGLGPK